MDVETPAKRIVKRHLKKIVNTVNVYDASKYGIESDWVENGVDVEVQLQSKLLMKHLKKELRRK